MIHRSCALFTALCEVARRDRLDTIGEPRRHGALGIGRPKTSNGFETIRVVAAPHSGTSETGFRSTYLVVSSAFLPSEICRRTCAGRARSSLS